MRIESMYCLILSIAITLAVNSQEQPISPLVNSFSDYNKMQAETTYGLEWISLGPVINSARVEAIQVDHNNPSIMYAAFGSGNLWKTTNQGHSWKPIFNNQPAQGIGDIALAPSNTNIIYLGTGESLKKPRNFTMPGTGIYRSDDAGLTWRHLGLDDSWHIGEIAVHPGNPDIVLVAVLGHFWTTNPHRGIYRTTNGGENWEQVLYIDENTGANDIVFAPSNPDVVYASMWENNPEVSGANSGIYQSTDGGKTWQQKDAGIPKSANTGRIGLAVSYQNPNKVYVLLDHRNKKEAIQAAEVYKTTDGGLKWEKTHEEDGHKFLSVLGWYFADIYVNPQDDDEIFALGVRLAHSKDGGKTFNYMGGDVFHFYPSPARTLHLDHCELWINPHNPNHLALGNDGGFYLSYNQGQSWTHFNNIPAGEFYDITLNNQQPYQIFGGTQDDATVYGPAKEWYPQYSDDWKYLWIDAWSGGDGCQTYIDPTNPDQVYYSSQHGGMRRMSLQTGASTPIRPKQLGKDDKMRTNFISPYLLSNHNPHNLYFAGNYILKSHNKGDDWIEISGDITISQDSLKNSHAAGALAESKLKPGLLYVGTDKGACWVTTDDGETWQEHSVGLPNNYIRCICPSTHHESRVYITLTGMNYDDLGSYIYQSEDYGKNWQPLMANLPSEVINVVLEDPFEEDIIYAGSLRGVYVSLNRGQSWSLLGKNLPMVSIADLEIEPFSRDLVIATHVRGIYKLNLRPIYEQLQLSKEQAYLFSIPPAKRPLFRDSHHDPDYQTIEKVPFTFWVNEDQMVELAISNETDSIIWTSNFHAEYGLNQLRWNLITNSVESDNPYFIHYDQFIKKGKYNLELITPTARIEEPFIVIDHE